MEKLLHERLREWGKARPFRFNEAWESLGVAGNDNMFLAIADEIERYYIPRPRFEDGEPVQFGDKFLRWDGKNGNDGENVTEIAVQSGDYYRWSLNGDCCTSQLVARPTPKVCDADGVEVKVGQKRWGTEGGNEYDVLEIKPDGSLVKCGCPSNDELFVWLAPSQLTHERPVFDAEGVRICKGDTVYDVDGINTEPMRVLSYGDALVNVMSKSGIEKNYEFNELTHREPDSLEKLQRFAVDSAAYAEGCEQDKFLEIADRLTALIERGA